MIIWRERICRNQDRWLVSPGWPASGVGGETDPCIVQLCLSLMHGNYLIQVQTQPRLSKSHRIIWVSARSSRFWLLAAGLTECVGCPVIIGLPAGRWLVRVWAVGGVWSGSLGCSTGEITLGLSHRMWTVGTSDIKTTHSYTTPILLINYSYTTPLLLI